jgi:hypothetical protein
VVLLMASKTCPFFIPVKFFVKTLCFVQEKIQI